ncbi:hypothetical protein V6N12_016351 [Hibiscus sabdariffa]|uniref:Uncharacterized protein n=1 Tax=Hibiscus sabdariffa TaxID=183260 RepID=A0ABR2CDC0_9ROSI
MIYEQSVLILTCMNIGISHQKGSRGGNLCPQCKKVEKREKVFVVQLGNSSKLEKLMGEESGDLEKWAGKISRRVRVSPRLPNTENTIIRVVLHSWIHEFHFIKALERRGAEFCFVSLRLPVLRDFDSLNPQLWVGKTGYSISLFRTSPISIVTNSWKSESILVSVRSDPKDPNINGNKDQY